MGFKEKYGWYPPAETKIPFAALRSAIRSPGGNFHPTISSLVGAKNYAVGSSGRALLAALLKVLHAREGGKRNEVLLPGYTCYSVAASVARAGLKISVYDVDPSSLYADLDSVRRAASGKTLAIVSQHLFGIPTPLSGFAGIAKKIDAYLIEDAAQALGGGVNGVSLGQTGDFGLFSFGRGKPLPLGAGGVLIGKDKDVLAAIAQPSANRGVFNLLSTTLARLIANPAIYWLPEKLPLGLGATTFDPDFPISPMPGAVARLAVSAAPLLVSFNRHRRDIAAVYSRTISRRCLFTIPDGAEPVYTRFPVMAGNKTLPCDLMRLGVRRMYPKAIAREKAIKPFLTENTVFTPGAVEIAANLIVLPTHSGISRQLARSIAFSVKRQYSC